MCRCLAMLFLLPVAWPAHAASFDGATRHYLEGIWLIGQAPDKGACVKNFYEKTQIEFEFRKSGGRALIYEPADLFTPIALSDMERDGHSLRISARSRDGKEGPFLHLRLQPPDRLEMLPKDGAAPDAMPEIAYRCGAPDAEVTAKVPMSRLSLLTPNVTGGWGLTEAVPGFSDAEICTGKDADDRKLARPTKTPREVQFELLGPVHHWIMGTGFGEGRDPEFDYVRSVETIDRHRMKLHMQKHGPGAGWDGGQARSPRYDLTIIDRGSRLEIPEWSASFVQCPVGSEGSIGMHRW